MKLFGMNSVDLKSRQFSFVAGCFYISYGERLVKNNLESQEEIFSLGCVNQSRVAGILEEKL